MTLILVLVVVFIVQLVFLILLLAALIVNRARSRHNRKAVQRAAERVIGPLREWLVKGGPPAALLLEFRKLPRQDAVEVLLRVTATLVPHDNAAELAGAIRDEPWVARGLCRAHSAFWWRRMEAARLLAFVGNDGDRSILLRLLSDSSPAVRVVAAGALARLGNTEAVESVLNGFPTHSRFVQLQQTATLKTQWMLVTPLLAARITAERDTERLLTWLTLADGLGAVDLFEPLSARRTHPEPAVRFAVALALRNFFRPRAVVVLEALLDDVDASVRARAAQSLGALGAREAIAALSVHLDDPHWDVRFRSAVALAQLGERGREALRSARKGADRFASDMAATVIGLSAGALNELAEG